MRMVRPFAETESQTEPLTGVSEAIYLRDSKPEAALLIVFRHSSQLVLLSPQVPLTIGRVPQNGHHLRIDDPKLSREHARFTLSADEHSVFAEDLGSRNGMFCQEQRVQSCELKAGDELWIGQTCIRFEQLGASNKSSPPAPKAGQKSPGTVIASAVMRELYNTAERIAQARIAVLLLGETGTGKEIFARFIHDKSPRREQPIVTLNCGAIPSQLVESTLFGHEKGSFTGALNTQKGVFEAAEGGTVFLDEIGELPASAQAALLRVLETGRFQRVGTMREQKADVRLITATHKNLEALSARGEFRADLYYRLSGVVLELPPLRERPSEIEALAMHFLETESAQNGRSIRAFDPEALQCLKQYNFPGNVRELRNMIARAVVLAEGDRVRLRDLPKALSTTPARADALPEKPSNSEEARSELRDQLQRYEAETIRGALIAAHWKRADAALALGMPLRTLAHKIKMLGIKKSAPE